MTPFEELINKVKKDLDYAINEAEEDISEESSWNYQKGVLLSYREAETLIKYHSLKPQGGEFSDGETICVGPVFKMVANASIMPKAIYDKLFDIQFCVLRHTDIDALINQLTQMFESSKVHVGEYGEDEQHWKGSVFVKFPSSSKAQLLIKPRVNI